VVGLQKVRVRDPLAQAQAAELQALFAASASSQAKRPGGGPPVASLRPGKAYPLMAAKLQLGEFAGYVRLDATGDTDDCYVLLDASRQVNAK
jgi:hypothetical protein